MWVYVEDVSVGVHGGCQCGCADVILLIRAIVRA